MDARPFATSMKKIKQHIIGFPESPILRPQKFRVQKLDWYCNAIKPLNTEKIPDQIEEEIHYPNERKLIVSVYKDTSDAEKDRFGNAIEINKFLEKPKRQNISEYNKEGKRIKITVISNQKIESYTTNNYDENGNLILSEYHRLGYVQHKNEYKYDSWGNLVEQIHIKDVSHGNEVFEKESASKYVYQFEESKIIQETFKFVEREKIKRGVNEYKFKTIDEITDVEIKMLHLKTQNKVTYFKKYDQSKNLIEDYSIQSGKYHPHSTKYEFEYRNQDIWNKRWRKTMEGILTLYTERKINL